MNWKYYEWQRSQVFQGIIPIQATSTIGQSCLNGGLNLGVMICGREAEKSEGTENFSNNGLYERIIIIDNNNKDYDNTQTNSN